MSDDAMKTENAQKVRAKIIAKSYCGTRMEVSVITGKRAFTRHLKKVNGAWFDIAGVQVFAGDAA